MEIETLKLIEDGVTKIFVGEEITAFLNFFSFMGYSKPLLLKISKWYKDLKDKKDKKFPDGFNNEIQQEIFEAAVLELGKKIKENPDINSRKYELVNTIIINSVIQENKYIIEYLRRVEKLSDIDLDIFLKISNFITKKFDYPMKKSQIIEEMNSRIKFSIPNEIVEESIDNLIANNFLSMRNIFNDGNKSKFIMGIMLIIMLTIAFFIKSPYMLEGPLNIDIYTIIIFLICLFCFQLYILYLKNKNIIKFTNLGREIIKLLKDNEFNEHL